MIAIKKRAESMSPEKKESQDNKPGVNLIKMSIMKMVAERVKALASEEHTDKEEIQYFTIQ
jgi:hypothetical protein